MSRQKHLFPASTKEYQEDIEVERSRTFQYYECMEVECACEVRWSPVAKQYVHDCHLHLPKHDHGHQARPNKAALL